MFARLPLADNYFWRVYLHGHYTPECCPEYLKPDNFERLKDGLAERVRVSTDTVKDFLEKNDVAVSRFVLLDHMDWLSDHLLPALQDEWQWILRRAAPQTRIIWRSGGLRTEFVDRLRLDVGRPAARTWRNAHLPPRAGPRTARAMPRPHLRQFPHCRPGRMKTLFGRPRRSSIICC